MLKDWIMAEINAWLLEFEIYDEDIPASAVRRLADKIVEEVEDE